uniref:VQ domain-containing protein n=1 Tax=Leersia perrieri TaxID=77586 RepID=A0A0D9X331_9ORYZ
MDAALSCLAPPHAADIFARALHFSTMPDTTNSSSSAAASPSSSSSAAFLATGGGAFALSAPTMPAITCESVLVADTARPTPAPSGRRHHQLGPAASGRGSGKRRSRASKRAPTTYISTDPANFRIMVQHVTGVQADPSLAAADNIIAHLPTTTASSHLLDTTTTAASAFATNPMLMQEPQQHHYQQQQQPCFPTLDSSWSAVMYDHLL